MAVLSVPKTIQTTCAALAVAFLFGCERRPNAAQSLPEKPASPSENVGPSSRLERSTPQTTPAEDAQTSINRVRARLTEEFGSRSPDLKDIAKLHAAWNDAWHPAFDTRLESASSPEVANGQIVPPEVMAHLKDTTSTAELFARDQAGFVSDRKEFEAAYALTLIASSVCMGTGSELPAFLNRAGSLPPTKGDVVVFRALSDGLLFLEHPAVLNGAQFTGWQQLAMARNPVYRLIAARTFHLVSSDLAQKSEIYRGLLADSDPAIARIAVTAASRYVTPETAAALNEFRDRQRNIGNTDLAEAATKALARVQKRP